MGKDDGSDKGTIVIGAGIVGASIAYHLARRGADVTIVDRVGAAAGATGKSFAWINAHHIESEAYHRLRYQSLAEYHRLDRDLDGIKFNHLPMGSFHPGSMLASAADGSVHTIGEYIDIDTYQALATCNGDEADAQFP